MALLIKKNGDFELVRKNLKVPVGSSVRDFLFKEKFEDLVTTNHNDELMVVSSEDDMLLKISYDEVKQEIRRKFSSHTVFPIVENFFVSCVPIGTVRFEEKWVISISPENEVHFFGDSPKFDVQTEIKQAFFAYVPAIMKGAAHLIHLWIPIEESEKQLFQDIVKSEEIIFNARGMVISHSVPRINTVQRWVLVSRIGFEREKYDDIGSIVKCVHSVKDVVVWRDYKTGRSVPSDVEASIITAGLFFCAEGFAAFNMLVIGAPATGKTFMLDCAAYLMGTTVHAMEQSTLKGLVFSHQGGETRGSGFGQKGILFREKFVACLNEFLRVVVRSQQRAAHKDEMSRLFASLNDAVERKKNRARSSGNVVDAEGFCSCSMITTDNDFPMLIQPFAFTMFEDASYLRRYSILRLSKETEVRGQIAKVLGVPWKQAVDGYLSGIGLGGGRWARLMRFWRSQVSECMRSFDFLNIVRFANVKKKVIIDALVYRGAKPVFTDDFTFMTYQTMMQADFTQLAVACQVSAIIMGSTFRAKEGYPVLERRYEDNVLATRMLVRLMEDMFKVIGDHLPRYIQVNDGVRRT